MSQSGHNIGDWESERCHFTLQFYYFIELIPT